ncbi:MAG TPA: PAS domain S-box protein [Melioribacteraceae bacterium]|nr:PAS domain S-box protein [Melioribacteraceae bacterium]
MNGVKQKQSRRFIGIAKQYYAYNPNTILLLNTDGIILDINIKGEELLGYNRSIITKQNIQLIIDLSDENSQGIIKAILTKKEYSGETTFIKKTGNKFKGYFNTRIIIDEKKNRIIEMGIEKRRNKKSKGLKDENRDNLISEDTYKILFDNNPLPMWIYDVDTLKFISVNNSATKNYGYSRDDFLNMTLTDIRPSEDVPMLIENIKKEREIIQRSRVFRHKKKDGTIINVEISSHSLPTRREGNYRLVMAIDITEQFNAEKKLIESEERFRRLIDNAEDLIYRYEFKPNRGFTLVNNAATKITGFTPEEHYADPDLGFKLVHPEDKRILEKISNNGKEINQPIELRWVKKDGTVIYTEQRNVPIIDDKGELVAIEGIARDITERKRVESILRDSEERFRAYINQAADALFVHDFRGKFVDVNERACSSIGYTREELLNMTVFDIETDFNLESAQREWIKIMPGNSMQLLGHHKRKDGSKFPIEVQFGCFDLKGIRYYMGLVRDITERVKTEAALRESEEKLRLFIEYTPAAIAMLDTNMRYIATSKRWLTDYGLGSKTIMGSSHYDLFPELPKRWREMHKRCLNGEVIDPFEDKLEGENGNIRWFRREIKSWYKTRDQIGGLIIFAEDITERKMNERDLVESQKKLKNIIDHSTNLFYSHDTEQNIKYVSPQLKDILGYNTDEGFRAWTNFVSDNPLNKIGIQKTLEAIKCGKPQGTYELELVHKNGKKVWVEVREAPVVENGVTTLIVGSLTDITERKIIESGLKKRLEFELSIASISSRFLNISQMTIDREINEALKRVGKVAQVDRTYLFIFSEDLSICDNTHEWCGEGITPQIDNLKKIPTSIIPWWMESLKRNETIHIPRVENLPEEAREEKVILEAQEIKSLVVVPLSTRKKLKGFIGFDSVKNYKEWMPEDIVLLKMLSEILVIALDKLKSDELLKKSEEKYKKLVDTAPDVIYSLSHPEGIITSLNPVFENITGWEIGEWIGRPFKLLIHPEDIEKTKIPDNLIRDKRLFTMELRVRKKNEEYLVGEFTNVAEVKDNKVTGIFGIVHNITERKLAEEQLRILMNRLIESEEIMRKSASGQLHDQVGQNLTALTINLNYIISQLPGEASEKLTTRLNDSLVILNETIDQIRDIMVELRPTVLEDYGLNAALNWSINKFAERTKINVIYNGKDLEKELPINTGYIIFRSIQEVFHNISKHARAENVKIELIEKPEAIKIEVKDDGIGFSMKKVREMKNSISFGLSSIEERMKLIGGKLEISSEPGKGTVVIIEIGR